MKFYIRDITSNFASGSSYSKDLITCSDGGSLWLLTDISYHTELSYDNNFQWATLGIQFGDVPTKAGTDGVYVATNDSETYFVYNTWWRCPKIRTFKELQDSAYWVSQGWSSIATEEGEAAFIVEICTYFKNNIATGYNPEVWGLDNGEINVLYFKFTFDALPGKTYIYPIFYKGNDEHYDRYVEI